MKSRIITLLTFASLCGVAQLTPITWQEYTIKDPQQSAGFVEVADINGDGKLDVLLSTLMEEGSAANQATTRGAIRYFEYDSQSGISGSWAETTVLPTDSLLPFVNHPQIYDVNEDGELDILVQQGFLMTQGGSHQWLEGPNFNQMHAFSTDTENGNTDYFWHESEQIDLDGDGKLDIVTTSGNNEVTPVGKKIEWYRHLGNGNFEHHIICDTLGGVFIKLYDIDGDHDEDIIVSQFFGFPGSASLVWLENVAPPSASNNYQGSWVYHEIDRTTGLGYYFEFFDFDLDGQDELVYVNHNNLNNGDIVDQGGNPIESGVYFFEIPNDPVNTNQWQKVVIDEGFPIDAYDFGNPASQGSPGIFDVGDVDGNGYPDIVLPGDGTDNLFLIRQEPGLNFTREVIATGTMFGMAKIVDLDGDGEIEVVAAMHDFPEIWEVLFPPAGHLKVYKPTTNCSYAATIEASNGLMICEEGNTTTLSVSNASYVVWNNPLSTNASVIIDTTRTVNVIATDANGCSVQETIDVVYSPVATPSINQSGNTLTCSETALNYQWYLNGSAIQGATSQSYDATQPGDYSVEITDNNGCSAMSGVLTITQVDLNELTNQMIKIYPNPCDNELYLDFGDEIDVNTELEIITLQGKLIQTISIRGDRQVIINTSELASGVYLIKARNQQYIRPISFVKQ